METDLTNQIVTTMSMAGLVSMSTQGLAGALWEMYAIRPTRRELRLASYASSALIRRNGDEYALDREVRLDWLVREMFGELPD
jgi:hypothetical protein